VLGGKGDPYLVDLFLGLLQARLIGLHRSVRRHCSRRCRKTDEAAAAAALGNERGIENLEGF